MNDTDIERVKRRGGFGLAEMRLASFARVWLALRNNKHDDCPWNNNDPEFAFFDPRPMSDTRPFTDSMLLELIREQASIEGHRFPEDIEKTLSVMLYS